jgi:hypothetical protein
MSDYDVGYGKPPKSGRFKPGVSGNPKGRPKRKPSPLADSIKNAINRPIEYRQGGRIKRASTWEVTLMMLVDRALARDVAAAHMVISIRARAEQFGDTGIDQIEVSGWLADHFGQTGEQKARDLIAGRDAKPEQWWRTSEE